MSFIIRYLSGQTARRVTFALTFLNNDYLVKGIAVVKCTEWHSYTLVRLSVLIRRRPHHFRIARRTGVAHLGVIGKRKHRIQEPP